MLLTLDRYLMSEVLKSLFSIMLVLVLILAGLTFINYLDKVAAGTVAHDVMLTMLGLEMSKELGLLFPPAFFFAVLSTLGRMYQNSEMTALFAGGVGRGRIFRAYVWVVLPVMLIAAWLMLYARPLAYKSLQQYKDQQEETAEVVNLSAGKFNESNSGDIVLYVEEMNEPRTEMKNIFVQHRDKEKEEIGLIKSNSGYMYTDSDTGDRFMVLVDGYRYDGQPGNADYRVATFSKYAVRLNDGKAREELEGPKFRTMQELWGSTILSDRIELQLRLSAPLAVAVFAVLSIPLSRGSPRQGMAGRMVLALLVYFLFFNLQALSGKWMEKGITPLWMGRWWVHLLMLGLAGLLMVRDSLWYAARVRDLKRKILGGWR